MKNLIIRIYLDINHRFKGCEAGGGAEEKPVWVMPKTTQGTGKAGADTAMLTAVSAPALIAVF